MPTFLFSRKCLQRKSVARWIDLCWLLTELIHLRSDESCPLEKHPHGRRDVANSAVMNRSNESSLLNESFE